MSWTMFKYVKSLKGLSGPSKSILYCIADYYNDEKGSAWPSMETIAEHTSYHRSTVVRHIDGLVREGILVKERQYRKNGHFSSNKYAFNLVAHNDAAEDGEGDKDVAKKSAAMSQSEVLPCRTEQQKPLPKPLTITLKNNEVYKKAGKGDRTHRTLSEKQEAFARKMAERYFEAYKHEHFYFDDLLADCRAFLLTSTQSDDDWHSLGNGLPTPCEMGLK